MNPEKRREVLECLLDTDDLDQEVFDAITQGKIPVTEYDFAFTLLEIRSFLGRMNRSITTSAYRKFMTWLNDNEMKLSYKRGVEWTGYDLKPSASWLRTRHTLFDPTRYEKHGKVVASFVISCLMSLSDIAAHAQRKTITDWDVETLITFLDNIY